MAKKDSGDGNDGRKVVNLQTMTDVVEKDSLITSTLHEQKKTKYSREIL